MTVTLLRGEALDILRTLPDASVDALVTDPPAGISFMGKAWDGDKGGRDAWIAWLAEIMREALRVLKPGAHALVWALPRTSHWTATAIEDAGFEIRDVVAHLYGTGFPKSADVSKAIDKMHGAEREVIGSTRGGVQRGGRYVGSALSEAEKQHPVTAPATDDARRWQGFGTALKPAREDWILARKPLNGTVAANVIAHGTGALNIDGCRIGDEGGTRKGSRPVGQGHGIYGAGMHGQCLIESLDKGRWPANVTLDEEAARALDEQSGTDAARFFYVAKPSTAERDAGLGRRNAHPTVKPIALVRWLVRLITPPVGVVLDMFAGSGTTGIAAQLEGMDFIGIEREAEYVEIARARIAAWREYEDKPKRAPKTKRTKAPKPEAPRAKPSAPQLALFGDAA